MRIPSFVMAALVIGTTASAAQGGAANPVCSDPAFVGPKQDGGDACQRAFDTFAYTTQQYGIMLTAGNMELGRADALGGFPHFRAAIRATGIVLYAPGFETTNIPVRPVTPGDVYTQSYDFATVELDGMLGLFRGFALGATQIGALDAWLSVNVVPGASASGYNVSSQNKVYFGWGGRLGLLQEARVVPGVSVSYFARNMPKATITAADLFGNSISVTNFEMDTHAWSATVGKHFGVVGLILGGGQTYFSSSANVGWTVSNVTPTVQPPIAASATQTQYFGDFSLTLGDVDFVLEIGEVSGSNLTTYNSFDPTSGSSRSFASAAITFGHY